MIFPAAFPQLMAIAQSAENARIEALGRILAAGVEAGRAVNAARYEAMGTVLGAVNDNSTNTPPLPTAGE